MKLPTFAFLCIAIACHAGLADAATQVRPVAGKNVELIVPDGFCIPDPQNSADTNFVQGLANLMKNAGSVLVQTFLGCEDQKRRRASAAVNIYDYIAYYYPSSGEREVLDGDRVARRKTLCDQTRSQNLEVKDVQQSVAKSAEELRRNIAINNIKELGVLAEDEHGCYLGLLVGVAGGKNNTYLVHVIVAATILHGKSLFFGLYSKYEDETGAAQSLRRAQSIATELDSKNPD
jgi:hypothetical protein